MENIVEAIKNAVGKGYDIFGIRTIEECAGLLKVGDSVPDSYDWDTEKDVSTRETTGETLDGASAVRINTDYLFMDGTDDDDLEAAVKKALEESKVYFGDQVLLIGGKGTYAFGYDDNEVIIKNADVIAIIK